MCGTAAADAGAKHPLLAQIQMMLLQALVLSVPDPSQPFSSVAPTRDHPFIKELISRQGTCCQAASAEGLKHGAAARLQLLDAQSCCLLSGRGMHLAVWLLCGSMSLPECKQQGTLKHQQMGAATLQCCSRLAVSEASPLGAGCLLLRHSLSSPAGRPAA